MSFFDTGGYIGRSAVYPTTIRNVKVFDTFTDTDSTSITSHTPDVDAGDTSYRLVATYDSFNSALITSNRLRGNVNTVTTGVCLIDSGVSDCTITCDLSRNSTNPNHGGTGIGFRFSGSTGYYVDFYAVGGTTRTIRLMETNGTSGSEVTSAAFSHNDTTFYTMKIVLSGSSIKVYMDDVEYISTTDSTYTGTEHGPSLLTNSTSVYSLADNFRVTA